MAKIRISIKYLVLLILSAIFLYVQGGSLTHVIFYMLFITFLISFISIIIARFGLNISNVTTARFYTCGEKEYIDTMVKNNTIFILPYCNITNEGIAKIKKNYSGDAVTLSVNEHRIISEELIYICRGKFDLGTYEVELKDLFGIFSLTYKIEGKKQIKIFPRVYDVSGMSIRGSDIIENTLSVVTSKEDPHSTKDMRKYREGDSLKRINWKVSAKLNDLYVRNFDTVSGEEFNIFIDMNQSNYLLDPYGKNEEMLMDFSASLIYSFLKRSISTRLFVNNLKEETLEIENKIDFEKFLNYLIEHKSEGTTPITSFIQMQKLRLSSVAGMAIITHTLSEKLLTFMMENKERGNSFVLFYLKSEINEDSVLAMSNIGIVCHKIDEEILDEEVAVSIEELIKGQVS
ncbi:DUF58 domain-containing protein [Clostridium manihotivorum]|uniref:DUF58 domain-containing protein n=1 Tax=Clostridium manihotivorum TaxID=2320868 RepID=A0A410DZS8_9CLOT|nr:DUF58 domain-containing protein [Clostridium manihotivorum]QAA34597.1 hypothetical protein C1I91_24835 [Clostridium manihotivorum]